MGPRAHRHARGSAGYSACFQTLWKCTQAVLYKLCPPQIRAGMQHGVWEALDALYSQRGGAWTCTPRCWGVHCWQVIYLGEEAPKASAGGRVRPGLQGLEKDRTR